MGKLANAAFYLFTFSAFASMLIVLLSQKPKHYAYAAICAFISIGGLYLLLKSPLMFIFHILFCALCLGAMIAYIGKNAFFKETKNTFNFNFLTVISPFAFGAFILLLIPFIAPGQNASKITALDTREFISSFIGSLDINLLLVSLFTICALSGFYTLAFWRKK